jgi:hypothetical protein
MVANKINQNIVDEILERVIATKIPNLIDLKTTKIGSWSDHDFCCISANTQCVGDVKVRSKEYTEDYFWDKGLFIEVHKYEKLIKLAGNGIPLYINYISSGKIFIINLNDVIFKETNVDYFIRSKQEYQPRHIIDLNQTDIQIVMFDLNKYIERNKKELNDIYLFYNNKNNDIINLLGCL